MDWDLIKTVLGCMLGCILLFGLVLILCLPLLYGVTKYDQYRYGGKTIHCIEDNGAEWTATISYEFMDTLIYFDNDDGIKFMSDEGKLMQCRGSYNQV